MPVTPVAVGAKDPDDVSNKSRNRHPETLGQCFGLSRIDLPVATQYFTDNRLLNAPVNMDEAGLYHAPGDGYDIAAKPKITPDNQNYYMLGHIEAADEKGGWFVARIKHAGSMDPRMDRAMREMRQLTGRTKEPYFFVQIPKPLAKFFLANARVNGAAGVIGLYVVNSELPFTSGQKVTMPVISAVALDFDGVYSSIPLPKPKMKATNEESAQNSEGVIFINGRGRVVSSGTPNKKELQCVYDLVDKE